MNILGTTIVDGGTGGTTEDLLLPGGANNGVRGTATDVDILLTYHTADVGVRGAPSTGNVLVPSFNGGVCGTTAVENMLLPPQANGGTRGITSAGDVLHPTSVNGRVCCRVACTQRHGRACTSFSQRQIVIVCRQHRL